MNTTLIHVTRDGEPMGSWPACLLPRLVATGTLNPLDVCFVEGMTEVCHVEDFLAAGQPAPVAIANPVRMPSSQTVAVEKLDLPFSQIFVLVFKVFVAVIPAALLLMFVLALVSASITNLAVFWGDK